LKFPGLSEALLKESRDDDRLIRQLSAFTLGLISDADAQSRLEQMLDDPDLDTRINAAVGLARHGNARGAAVFEEVLKTAAQPPEPASDGEYEHYLALKNCIAAIERVATALDENDRREFAVLMEPLLQPIAADYREPQIRVSARTALNALHEAR
jgi:HEAT repeat protein